MELHAWAAAALGWLATYAVHSTILLALAWLIARRGRLSEANLDVLWKVSLVGGLITASAQGLVGREPLAGQLELFAPAPRALDRRVEVIIRQRSGEATPAPLPRLRDLPPSLMSPVGDRILLRRTTDRPWPIGIVAVWLLGALVTFACLLRAHRRLAVRLSACRDVDDDALSRSLAALLRLARIDRPVRLTCSNAIGSPVAMRRGEICLPMRALAELDAGQQESILAHEVAHLVRRDPAWLLLARLIETVFFFQPLNRVARRGMQEAAEYLCDDWAVQRTGRPLLLAKCLASVAEWLRPDARAGLLSAMVETGGSPLVRRVKRILAPRVIGAPSSRRGVLAASALALLVLTGAAPRVAVADLSRMRTAFFVLRDGLELPDASVVPGGVPARVTMRIVNREGGNGAARVVRIERDEESVVHLSGRVATDAERRALLTRASRDIPMLDTLLARAARQR